MMQHHLKSHGSTCLRVVLVTFITLNRKSLKKQGCLLLWHSFMNLELSHVITISIACHICWWLVMNCFLVSIFIVGVLWKLLSSPHLCQVQLSWCLLHVLAKSTNCFDYTYCFKFCIHVNKLCKYNISIYSFGEITKDE
jgi:hypothetical protein